MSYSITLTRFIDQSTPIYNLNKQGGINVWDCSLVDVPQQKIYYDNFFLTSGNVYNTSCNSTCKSLFYPSTLCPGCVIGEQYICLSFDNPFPQLPSGVQPQNIRVTGSYAYSISAIYFLNGYNSDDIKFIYVTMVNAGIIDLNNIISPTMTNLSTRQQIQQTNQNNFDSVMNQFISSGLGINDPYFISFCNVLSNGTRRTDIENSGCQQFSEKYCEQGTNIVDDEFCYKSITPGSSRPNQTYGPSWADDFVFNVFCQDKNNLTTQKYLNFCSCVNDKLPLENCTDPICQGQGYKTKSIIDQNCADTCFQIFNLQANGNIYFNQNQLNQACQIAFQNAGTGYTGPTGATGTSGTVYDCVKGVCGPVGGGGTGRWVNDPTCGKTDPCATSTYNCVNKQCIVDPSGQGSYQGYITCVNDCQASPSPPSPPSPPSSLPWWGWLLITLGILILICTLAYFGYREYTSNSSTISSKKNSSNEI